VELTAKIKFSILFK